MDRTTNQVGKKEGADLQLYILPFKNESCFKIGITFDIYDRGSQLGFANFDWASGYLIQATESHTIAGIESFLKKHLWAFRPKEIPRLSSGNTEIYTNDALARVLSIVESFSSMPFLGVRIAKGIAIDAIIARRVSESGARGGQINKAVVNGRKRPRPETAFLNLGRNLAKHWLGFGPWIAKKRSRLWALLTSFGQLLFSIAVSMISSGL